ncbi:type II secretion system F family protein (plasmid) [Cupriavidus metallidurans]|uniref:type II secretion system F family protein n=1 Tax=Cupriavidus metallidurans TaxID=119219 RepID=UPI003D755356
MSEIFAVHGMLPSGDLTTREYFAGSQRDARREAIQAGMIAVYDIRQIKESIWNYEYLGRDYRLKLLNALRFQVDAGVSIAQAIQAIVEGETKPLRRARLARTLIVIRRGGSLAEALDAVGLFDEHVIALIRAGEQTGLRQGVRAAIQHEEAKRTTWRQILSAVGVLSLELSTALSVPWSLHFYAVGFIRNSLNSTADKAKLASFISELDTITHVNLGWMILTYGLATVLSLWALGFMLLPGVRDRSWPYLRRFPLLGAYLRQASMANSTRIVSVMLTTGVRLGETVDAMARTVTHGEVKGFWSAVASNLRNGHDSVRAFRHDLITGSESLAIAAHQSSKQLGEILGAIAEEREYRRKELAKALLVMSVGLMVFYMIVSMGLALWAFKLYDAGATFNIESLQNLI